MCKRAKCPRVETSINASMVRKQKKWHSKQNHLHETVARAWLKDIQFPLSFRMDRPHSIATLTPVLSKYTKCLGSHQIGK